MNQRQRGFKRGRPTKTERDIAFDKVVAYLEDNDDEQISIKDLVLKMDEFLEESEQDAFTTKYMKLRLMSILETESSLQME
jgi:hypothetical protein